jgi:hypothetical protein
MLGGGVRSREICGGTGALPSQEAGSETTGHVTAPEPSQAEKRGLEPGVTWRHQSPLKLEARSRAAGRAA